MTGPNEREELARGIELLVDDMGGPAPGWRAGLLRAARFVREYTPEADTDEKPEGWARANVAEFHSKSSAYAAGFERGWDARRPTPTAEVKAEALEEAASVVRGMPFQTWMHRDEVCELLADRATHLRENGGKA